MGKYFVLFLAVLIFGLSLLISGSIIYKNQHELTKQEALVFYEKTLPQKPESLAKHFNVYISTLGSDKEKQNPAVASGIQAVYRVTVNKGEFDGMDTLYSFNNNETVVKQALFSKLEQFFQQQKSKQNLKLAFAMPSIKQAQTLYSICQKESTSLLKLTYYCFVVDLNSIFSKEESSNYRASWKIQLTNLTWKPIITRLIEDKPLVQKKIYIDGLQFSYSIFEVHQQDFVFLFLFYAGLFCLLLFSVLVLFLGLYAYKKEKKILLDSSLQALYRKSVNQLKHDQTTQENISDILESICSYLKCDYGHVALPDSRVQEVNATSIYAKDPKKKEVFKETFFSTHMRDDYSLLDRVLADEICVWISDIRLDQYFSKMHLNKTLGVVTAVGLPLSIKGKVIAVVELYFTEQQARDEYLVQSLLFLLDILAFNLEINWTLEEEKNEFLQNKILFNESDTFRLLVDTNGVIKKFNQQIEKTFHISSQAVGTQKLTDFFSLEKDFSDLFIEKLPSLVGKDFFIYSKQATNDKEKLFCHIYELVQYSQVVYVLVFSPQKEQDHLQLEYNKLQTQYARLHQKHEKIISIKSDIHYLLASFINHLYQQVKPYIETLNELYLQEVAQQKQNGKFARTLILAIRNLSLEFNTRIDNLDFILENKKQYKEESFHLQTMITAIARSVVNEYFSFVCTVTVEKADSVPEYVSMPKETIRKVIVLLLYINFVGSNKSETKEIKILLQNSNNKRNEIVVSFTGTGNLFNPKITNEILEYPYATLEKMITVKAQDMIYLTLAMQYIYSLQGRADIVEQNRQFNFTFTYNPVDEKVKKLENHESLENIRILLCETKKPHLSIVERLLSMWECVVDTAYTVQEAMTYLTNSKTNNMPYSIVIFDTEKQTQAIFSLYSYIRQESQAIKLVMLCTDSLEKENYKQKQIKANLYCIKPLKPQTFFDDITHLVQNQEESIGRVQKHILEFKNKKALAIIPYEAYKQSLTNLLEKEHCSSRMVSTLEEAKSILEYEKFDFIFIATDAYQKQVVSLLTQLKQYYQSQHEEIVSIALSVSYTKMKQDSNLVPYIDYFMKVPIESLDFKKIN